LGGGTCWANERVTTHATASNPQDLARVRRRMGLGRVFRFSFARVREALAQARHGQRKLATPITMGAAHHRRLNHLNRQKPTEHTEHTERRISSV
jgi:hypothetical protein